MIVRIHSSGQSFKGLATYLTHDVKAQTDERVGFIHTFQLAHDDSLSAVDEMLWTARHAELLKQEAGIRAGGRKTGDAIKHVSLNWSPEDEPSREHMIEAAGAFLKHMKWDEHQALLVAHEDKHPHLHIMLNAVHPETGLHLNDGFERRRAQAWAKAYELEQGQIRCDGRFEDESDRYDAPTRPNWLAFKNTQEKFEQAEKFLAAEEVPEPAISENPKSRVDEEWDALKDLQKAERLEFLACGKRAFSEMRQQVYQEVRDEYRPRWADFYALHETISDPDELAAIKASLISAQTVALAERRDEAYKELRQERDETYRELLEVQQLIRHGLRDRQAEGRDSLDCMELFGVEHHLKYHTFSRDDREMDNDGGERSADPRQGHSYTRDLPDGNFRSGIDIGNSVGVGIGMSAISIFDSLASGFVGSTSAPKPKRQEPDQLQLNLFAHAAEEARQKRSADEKELEDERLGRPRQ